MGPWQCRVPHRQQTVNNRPQLAGEYPKPGSSLFVILVQALHDATMSDVGILLNLRQVTSESDIEDHTGRKWIALYAPQVSAAS